MLALSCSVPPDRSGREIAGLGLTIRIISRGKFDDVESDDVQSFEAIKDPSDFSRCPTASFWCTG
jgi:hypothetical protein